MPKVTTALRLLAAGRIPWPARTILLRACKQQKIGDFRLPVNNRSILHVMRLLDHLGMVVLADVGVQNFSFWVSTRLTFECQKWSPMSIRRPALLVTDETRTAHDDQPTWFINYSAEPFRARDEHDVLVPYGRDPTLVHLTGAAGATGEAGRRRPIRILFAGGCSQEGYDRETLIWQRYGKRTRYSLAQYLRARQLIVEPPNLEALMARLEAGHTRDFVFVDTARFAIPFEQWLRVVAMADFFFCPPGCIMPMCHNLVEAMSVGTIPITNYPEWLHPELTHGDNCLGFTTHESLGTVIAEARDMSDSAIESMRHRVMEYHDRHLSYPSVAARLRPRMHEPLRLHVLDETFHRVEALPIVHPSVR